MNEAVSSDEVSCLGFSTDVLVVVSQALVWRHIAVPCVVIDSRIQAWHEKSPPTALVDEVEINSCSYVVIHDLACHTTAGKADGHVE